jgi:hypothetical protein
VLQARIRTLPDSARQDVVRFVKDPAALNIWSHDYFYSLASMVKFV